MKLRCDDGKVRRFKSSRCDGEWRHNVRVQHSEEAECLECGELFGVHDLHILKPMFRVHVCKEGIK